MTPKCIVALIGAALLAGCGKPAGDAPAAPLSDAQSLGGVAHDVPAYPGMQITNTFPSETGTQFLAQSHDSIDQVAGFYTREMPPRGWSRDRSLYTREDFLVFTKDQRQTRITLKPGVQSGVATMFSINVDTIAK